MFFDNYFSYRYVYAFNRNKHIIHNIMCLQFFRNHVFIRKLGLANLGAGRRIIRAHKSVEQKSVEY